MYFFHGKGRGQVYLCNGVNDVFRLQFHGVDLIVHAVDWNQRFVICDDGELWQPIQVDVILGDSKFDGSTFYFNLRISLFLECCRSAL